MKAVIVDIEGPDAVAMDLAGCFIKVKNPGHYAIGYEIDIPDQEEKKKRFNTRFLIQFASVAAAFLLFFAVGYGVYNQPYGYVDVDINPSIEITYNLLDRIIHVEGLNEDGNKVISLRSIKNKTIQEGIEKIIEDAVTAGFIKPDQENAVMITITDENEGKAKEIQEELRNLTTHQLESVQLPTEVLVETTNVKKHQDAQKIGISPGKLLLLERLKDVNPDIKIEDYKMKPVREIVKSIKGLKMESKKPETGKGTDKKQESPKDETTDIRSPGNDHKKQTDEESNNRKNEEEPSPASGKKLEQKRQELSPGEEKNKTNSGPGLLNGGKNGKGSKQEPEIHIEDQEKNNPGQDVGKIHKDQQTGSGKPGEDNRKKLPKKMESGTEILPFNNEEGTGRDQLTPEAGKVPEVESLGEKPGKQIQGEEGNKQNKGKEKAEKISPKLSEDPNESKGPKGKHKK